MANSIKRFTFTWKLEKFSMFPCAYGDKYQSPVFVNNHWKIGWFVQLSFDNEGHLVASLQKENNNHANIEMLSTFTLESIGPSSIVSVALNGTDQEIISLTKLFQNHNLYLPQDVLTLNCNFSPSPGNSFGLSASGDSDLVMDIVREYCVSRTTIKTFGKSFSWAIRNMHERKFREEKHSVYLPRFLNSNGIKLLLTLFEIPSFDCIQIIVKISENQPKELQLFTKCKISVISFRVNDQTFKQDTHIFYSGNKDHRRFWQFPAFITKSCLDQYLQGDGTLLLQCEFTFSYRDCVYHLGTTYSDCPPISEYNTNNKKIRELTTNIERLYYTGGKYCDVFLRVGTETFPTHKLVLCAISPAFDAMLVNDIIRPKVLEVSDVEPATLKRMLKFMHCEIRKEDLNLEDTFKLYKVAAEYQVTSLKRWCSIMLISHLSVKSVCDVLVLAHSYQDGFLRKAVDDFIRCHRDQVFSSTPLNRFTTPPGKLLEFDIKSPRPWKTTGNYDSLKI